MKKFRLTKKTISINQNFVNQQDQILVPSHRYVEEFNTITEEELVEPKTYNQAIHSEKKNEWIQAMKNEIKSLKK